MKVLLVLPNDHLGGAEQFLKMIAIHFVGCKVQVVFLKPKVNNAWDDVAPNIKLCFPNSESFIGLLNHLYVNLVKSDKYEYIFTSHVYVTALIDTLITFKIIRSKYFIARESTSIFSRFSGLKLWSYKLAYFIGYRNMNIVICQTQFMKKQLVNALPYLRRRTAVEVIENPIDLSSINKKSIESSNNRINGKYIVSAGRLIEEKGFDLLIKAFAKTNFAKKYSLVILGEGHERTKLEHLTAKLGLSNNVILMGHVPNVYPYFKNASLCVVSSRIEGFPNVLLQMMSQNNNVISTLCAGGIADIPGIYTVPCNNVDLLKESMIKALNEDNTKNRILFDHFLNNRSVPSFISRLKSKINEKKIN